ncbi:hypothetical protein RI056_07390 [Komagataeibacter nataicola]|nr:hypothetical protein RI056_07390 [Komagataeibacter nataicola]
MTTLISRPAKELGHNAGYGLWKKLKKPTRNHSFPHHSPVQDACKRINRPRRRQLS